MITEDGNWIKTHHIRFVERQVESKDTWPHPKTVRILQQKWLNIMGQEVWQDVPVEKEENDVQS